MVWHHAVSVFQERPEVVACCLEFKLSKWGPDIHERRSETPFGTCLSAKRLLHLIMTRLGPKFSCAKVRQKWPSSRFLKGALTLSSARNFAGTSVILGRASFTFTWNGNLRARFSGTKSRPPLHVAWHNPQGTTDFVVMQHTTLPLPHAARAIDSAFTRSDLASKTSSNSTLFPRS